MMLFSATYEKDVMDFASHILDKPMVLRLRREEESLDNIKQYYVVCKNEREKYQAITNIYGVVTIGQAMIFCHVCVCDTNTGCNPIRLFLLPGVVITTNL
jgi:ATP-dependent RNA helicase DDX19/DBP5